MCFDQSELLNLIRTRDKYIKKSVGKFTPIKKIQEENAFAYNSRREELGVKDKYVHQ